MKLLVVLIIMLSGCKTYRVTDPDGNIVRGATCNGPKLTFARCYLYASKNCPQGYKIIEKNKETILLEGNKGIIRSIVYTCKAR